jgi:hypothetical protein
VCVDVEASVGEDAEVLVLLAVEAEGVAVAAGEERGFWILDFGFSSLDVQLSKVNFGSHLHLCASPNKSIPKESMKKKSNWTMDDSSPFPGLNASCTGLSTTLRMELVASGCYLTLIIRKKSILLPPSLAYVQITPQTNIWFNLLPPTI